MTLVKMFIGIFFSFGCVWPIIFLTGFYIYFCHSAPRLAETTQVQSLYEPLLSSGVVIYHCFKMIRATEEKYSIPELAAWAQKPS
jgi:hypothetical protein